MNAQKIRFHDLHSTCDEFMEDVLRGLEKKPASIPPKYFYDAKGSRLFDAITQLSEYYPTRTEMLILTENASDIARHIGTGSLLVEPGGGSCEKVHILLEGLKPCAYVPMDISKDFLQLAAEELAIEYPWLEIHAVCTDFTRAMRVPPSAPEGTHVAFFPGSSIGNFTPDAAVEFLRAIVQLIGVGGYLLIGVDLKKDKAILEAAYNDGQGITAEFNLNLLTRINRELGADFDESNWEHKALYNERDGRIEMHLLSKADQTVQLNEDRFEFKQGDSIHTENSYKYTADEFIQLAERAGFVSDKLWIDQNNLFSVHLFKAV